MPRWWIHGSIMESGRSDVAKWLAAHGIAAFVLKYRIAYSGADYEEAKYVATIHTATRKGCTHERAY